MQCGLGNGALLQGDPVAKPFARGLKIQRYAVNDERQRFEQIAVTTNDGGALLIAINRSC